MTEPVPVPAGYIEALGRLHGEHAAQMARSLAARFPKMSASAAEDALADAFADAVADDKQRWFVEGFSTGGPDELQRRLYSAGWRHLRGAYRKVGHQRTRRMQSMEGFDPAGADDASERAEAGELAGWLDNQVDEATERYGRARKSTLARAMASLVRAGHAVKPLAERYELPRRYLAEASAWLKRRIRDRMDDDDS